MMALTQATTPLRRSLLSEVNGVNAWNKPQHDPNATRQSCFGITAQQYRAAGAGTVGAFGVGPAGQDQGTRQQFGTELSQPTSNIGQSKAPPKALRTLSIEIDGRMATLEWDERKLMLSKTVGLWNIKPGIEKVTNKKLTKDEKKYFDERYKDLKKSLLSIIGDFQQNHVLEFSVFQDKAFKIVEEYAERA